MFKDSSLSYAIGNTFKISIVATLVATVAGTLIAVGIILLQKKRKTNA